MSLHSKSIIQLRGIAQSFGIDNIFSKTDVELRQAIELAQTENAPKTKMEPIIHPYDARLMNKPPAKMASLEDINAYLDPYVARGLKFRMIDQETWEMRCGSVIDTGNIRMPPRAIISCAEKVTSQ